MDSSSAAGMTSPPSETGIEFDPSMLRQAVVTILRGADRSLVSAKGVRKELQGLYPFIDLKNPQRKEQVDKLTMEVFESTMNEGQEDDEDEDEEDVKPKQSTSRDSGSPPPKPKVKTEKKGPRQPTDEEVAYRLSLELNGPAKTTRGGGAGKPKASWGRKETKKSRATVDSDDDSADEGAPVKKKKRAATGGGYNKALYLSDELSAICGGHRILSRPKVVKAVWRHIKANDLQNPAKRNEIICDEAMRAVIPTARVSMFTMNKYFSNHLSPYDGPDEAEELTEEE